MQLTPFKSVPDPAGIDDPENENASTVVALADTVNPFASESPPLALDAQPSWSN